MAKHPKIKQIALTHEGLDFLVWSTQDAYQYGNDYPRFVRDAISHVGSMLQSYGCRERLTFRYTAETCAHGVFCVRIHVAEDYSDRTGTVTTPARPRRVGRGRK